MKDAENIPETLVEELKRENAIKDLQIENLKVAVDNLQRKKESLEEKNNSLKEDLKYTAIIVYICIAIVCGYLVIKTIF